MNLNEYQKSASRTMNHDMASTPAVAMLAMGLSGETGELVDYLKKGLFHDHVIKESKIEDELGDVLWYLANMASHFGIDLEDVAKRNIEKLKKRYPDGFDTEKSKNRDKREENSLIDKNMVRAIYFMKAIVCGGVPTEEEFDKLYANFEKEYQDKDKECPH